MHEQLNAEETTTISIGINPTIEEKCEAHGHYTVHCHDRDGNLKWTDEIENVVMTEGKNVMLDAALAGSAYTTVGPFMSLVTNTAFTAFAAGDTSASHTGWAESTNFSGTRQTMLWAAASAGSKSLSPTLTFTITGTDTLVGVSVWYGTGAVSTVASTAGKLLSGGAFSGGNRAVVNTDTVTVSYSFSI